MARCIVLPMVLVIAVVGLLLGGQQDMVQLFGTILAALVLDGTLAFVAFGAPPIEALQGSGGRRDPVPLGFVFPGTVRELAVPPPKVHRRMRGQRAGTRHSQELPMTQDVAPRNFG